MVSSLINWSSTSLSISKQTSLLRLLLVLVTLTANAAGSQPDCELLKPSYPEYQYAYVRGAGRYCVAVDFNQPKVWGHDQREIPIPSLLAITSSDVDVSMVQHNFQSEAKVESVVSIYPYWVDSEANLIRPLQSIANVGVHDGAISANAKFGVIAGGMGGYDNSLGSPISLWSDLKNTFDMLDAIDTEYYNRPRTKEYIRNLAREIYEKLPPTPADYPKRNITLENLHIKVNDYGAMLQGAGTVVRNCVIEVDKQTALFIFGPNALIENNTIIVTGQGPRVEGDAPIRLHQSDGSIIRNNKIIRKDDSKAQALTLVKSAKVTFENNELYGFDENNLVRSFDDASNHEEHNNQSKPLGLMMRLKY